MGMIPPEGPMTVLSSSDCSNPRERTSEVLNKQGIAMPRRFSMSESYSQEIA
jgi:hypothetical protein